MEAYPINTIDTIDTKNLAPYDWIAWLSERDAKMLLLSLMHSIEAGEERSGLQYCIDHWRMNAHKALTNEDWTATVDGFLEVKADARLYVFRTGHPPRTTQG